MELLAKISCHARDDDQFLSALRSSQRICVLISRLEVCRPLEEPQPQVSTFEFQVRRRYYLPAAMVRRSLTGGSGTPTWTSG